MDARLMGGRGSTLDNYHPPAPSRLCCSAAPATPDVRVQHSYTLFSFFVSYHTELPKYILRS